MLRRRSSNKLLPSISILRPNPHAAQAFGYLFRRLSALNSRPQLDLPSCLLSVFLTLGIQFFVRNMESSIGGGHSSVDSGLEQNFFEVAGFEVVGQACADVESEFLPAAERCGHSQHQKAAGPVAEAGAGPNGAPGIASYQFLELAVEVIGVGDGFVDVLLTEHGTAGGKSGFKGIDARIWRRQQEIQQRCDE